MNVKISIVQLVETGEHCIFLYDENGAVCTNEQYEEWLTKIGAEMVKKFY
jgi:hypothetical protein